MELASLPGGAIKRIRVVLGPGVRICGIEGGSSDMAFTGGTLGELLAGLEFASPGGVLALRTGRLLGAEAELADGDEVFLTYALAAG